MRGAEFRRLHYNLYTCFAESTDVDFAVMSVPAMQSSLEAPHSQPQEEKVDIEHAYVADDPRKWSSTRKVRYLCLRIIASF